MSLLDRINHRDRQAAAALPTTEERRVTDERRIPEWRKRAIEQHDRLGYVAVADLTEGRAA